MKLFNTALITSLLAATATLASPVPDGKLEKRLTVQIPPRNIQCNRSLFSPLQINSAVEKALDLQRRGEVRGTYPHVFNNAERIPLHPICSSAQALGYPLKEYPIMASGAVYNGGAPGAHRVVYLTGAASVSALFCGGITHEGAANPRDFVACSGNPTLSAAEIPGTIAGLPAEIRALVA